jgi:hypothetical protein
VKRRHQSARIDDRIDAQLGQTDGRPIAVREVDVTQRKSPRYKRDVLGIKLALDPVRPDPIEIVLNGAGVDDPAGMKQHARAHELDRLLHFRRLREIANPRKPQCRIGEPVSPGRPLHDVFPRQVRSIVTQRMRMLLSANTSIVIEQSPCQTEKLRKCVD